MSRLFWLSDDQWVIIEPCLPRHRGGARRVDDRRVISGIIHALRIHVLKIHVLKIHVLKSGCRCCDCLGEYGLSTTIYNHFNRWRKAGHWRRREL